jgi:hypothetical protein
VQLLAAAQLGVDSSQFSSVAGPLGGGSGIIEYLEAVCNSIDCEPQTHTPTSSEHLLQGIRLVLDQFIRSRPLVERSSIAQRTLKERGEFSDSRAAFRLSDEAKLHSNSAAAVSATAVAVLDSSDRDANDQPAAAGAAAVFPAVAQSAVTATSLPFPPPPADIQPRFGPGFPLSYPSIPDPSVSLPAPSPVSFTGSGTIHPLAPVIAEWQHHQRPNETVTLTGAQFSLRRGASFGSDCVVHLFVPGPNSLHRCTILRIKPDLLSVLLPPVPPCMYLLWVENEAGLSSPISLNRTDARWIGPLGDFVNANQPGQSKRIFGRSLSPSFLDSSSSAPQPPSLARVFLLRAGQLSLEPLTVSSSNPYCCEFAVPADLPAGSHSVFIHNTHGGELGWGGPLTLVSRAAFVRDSFTVALEPATSSPTRDRAADINAAVQQCGQRANGGTVQLAAGVYYLRSQVLVSSKVRLCGAGSGSALEQLQPGPPGEFGEDNVLQAGIHSLVGGT